MHTEETAVAHEVEEQVIRRLRAAGGIGARSDHPRELVVSVKGTEVRLHLEVKARVSDFVVGQFEELADESRERTVLVAPRLSRKRRQELRFRDISWIEYQTGMVHLRAPHLAIDLPEDPAASAPTPKTLPSLAGKAGAVVEALIELAHRHEWISQPEVADLSGSTQAWTSRVFSALVEAEALDVEGAGPAKRWRPRAEALLHLWEADGGPTPSQTPMYLWSRTSEDLIRAMPKLGEAATAYAVGGVAAANLHEPTLSSLPMVNVWIPATVPPAQVAAELGADPVESGANIILWQASGDPALTLAGPLSQWRKRTPKGLGSVSVVTPARAAIEALRGPGRAPEVGENLRQRILDETAAENE